MALSKKQRAFINAYLKCWNATQAAREAGYSESSVRVSGHRNITNDNISAEIEARVAEMTLDANETLMHLSDIAKPPVSHFDFFVHEVATVESEDGEAEVIRTAIDAEAVKKYGHLIKSISFTNAGPKIEFYSRMDALQLIGKHHGLFTDKHDITSGGEPIKQFTIDDFAKAQAALKQWQEDDANRNTDNAD